MRASSYGFLHVAPLTLLFFLLCATFTTATAQDNIQTQIDALAAGNFSAKAEAVDQLLATGHPRTAIVLQAMLESALQQRKSDNRIVISSKSGSNFQLQDAVTGEVRATVEEALERYKKAGLTADEDLDYRIHLSRAIDALPEIEREVIDLMLADIPIETTKDGEPSMTDLLGCVEKTVRNRRDRAYAKIRQALELEFDHDE